MLRIFKRIFRKKKKPTSTEKPTPPSARSRDDDTPTTPEPRAAIQPHTETPPDRAQFKHILDLDKVEEQSDEHPVDQDVSVPETSVAKTAWANLKEVFKVLSDGTDFFPPLKLALVGVVAVMDTIDRVGDVQNDFQTLADTMDCFRSSYEQYLSSPDLSPVVKSRLESLSREVASVAAAIEKKSRRGIVRRVLESPKDVGEVSDAFRKLDNTIKICQFSSAIRTEYNIDRIANTMELDKLGYVPAATIDAQIPTGCLDGTRVELLDDLKNWACDLNSPRVFWLDGMAGTGKSAVARTFCRWLDSQGLLGGSFFCSRGGTAAQGNVKRIIPTLAFMLASRDMVYKHRLLEIVKRNQVSAEMNIELQLKYLLADPLTDMYGQCSSNIVLVIDALDECADQTVVKDVLERILAMCPTLPIKFFVTSRPEPSIRNQFLRPHHSTHSRVLRLHDIEQDIVESDIRLYIHTHLQMIRTESDATFPSDWPTPAQLHALTCQAGKLFIYAFTAVNYIRERPLSRLETLVANVPEIPLTRALDDIYTHILSEAMDPNTFTRGEINLTRRILAAILTVEEPLSVENLGALLNEPPGHIKEMLDHLHSVISVPRLNYEGVLTTFHASFRDFLTSNNRAPSHLLVNLSSSHRDLFTACMFTMHSELRFNLSNCHTSYLPNSKQQLTKTKLHILYACLHWSHHFSSTLDSSFILKDVEAVFIPNFLFWLEVLSVTGNASLASNLIMTAFATVYKTDTSSYLTDFLHDANEFVISSLQAIETSAPHIYISALPFARPGSKVAHIFWPLFDCCANVSLFGIQHQKQSIMSLQGHTEMVMSVSVSSDGSHIATGSCDCTIRVWDAKTGIPISPPFIGHTKSVASIYFSPDGSCVISTSNDRTIRFWDTWTGECKKMIPGPIEGDLDSQIHSPDGMYIASTSGAKGEVYIISAKTGELVTSLKTAVPSQKPAFSPDGSCLASGSFDGILWVWDTKTWGLIAKISEWSTMKSLCNIHSLAFTPDGKTLAVGMMSDHKITILDACTWKELPSLKFCSPELHSMLHSVAFSLDGTLLALVSVSETFYVWNVSTSQIILEIEKQGKSFFGFIKLSANGSHIFECTSDGSIRVWDVLHSMQISNVSFEGHRDSICGLAFSPDGASLATCSYDRTICIWNTKTLEFVRCISTGHDSRILSLAYSPDGMFIASGTLYGELGMWNANSGAPVVRPFGAHKKRIYTIAFSPDGTQVASGSDDGSICVWDATAVTKVISIPGHNDEWIYMVCYSPDGMLIASCSSDCTVCMWDAHSGESISTIQFMDKVISLAFLPENKIAMAFSRGMVQVWNMQMDKRVLLQGTGCESKTVAIAPDGRLVASVVQASTVKIWHITNEQSALPQPLLLAGHIGKINAIQFSPDGSCIATCSHDKTARIWNIDKLTKASNRDDIVSNSLLGQITSLNGRGVSFWLKGPHNELVLWIPPDYRPYLQFNSSGSVLAQSQVVVDLDKFVHGTDWVKCYTPNA